MKQINELDPFKHGSRYVPDGAISSQSSASEQIHALFRSEVEWNSSNLLAKNSASGEPDDGWDLKTAGIGPNLVRGPACNLNTLQYFIHRQTEEQ